MQWGFGNCLALVLPILLVATVVVKYDNWYEVIGCTVTDWYWYWLHWYWPFYKPASPLFLFLAFEARYSHQNPQSSSLLCKTHFLLSIALFSDQSKQSNYASWLASQWNTFILPSWVAASSRFTIDQLTIQYLLLPFTTQIQIHIKVQSKIQNKINAQIQIKIHEQSGSTSWPFNTCFHLQLHLHLHPCMQLHTAQVFPSLISDILEQSTKILDQWLLYMYSHSPYEQLVVIVGTHIVLMSN